MPLTPSKKRSHKSKLSPPRLQQLKAAREVLAAKRVSGSSVAQGKRPAVEENVEGTSARGLSEDSSGENIVDGGIDLRYAQHMYPFHYLPRQSSQEEYELHFDEVEDYAKHANKLADAGDHLRNIRREPDTAGSARVEMRTPSKEPPEKPSLRNKECVWEDLATVREQLAETQYELNLATLRAASSRCHVFRLVVVFSVFFLAVSGGVGWFFGLNHPAFAFVSRPTVVVGAHRGVLPDL